jgi:hypothetical protein
MADRPAPVKRSMKATFTSVGSVSGSFCRPSLGPTS